MGYRIVRMSRELFEQMFVEGRTFPNADNERPRIVKGLPEGAKLDAVSMDVFFDSYGIALRFSHPDWPEEREGYRTPEAEVSFAMETTTQFRPWMFDELTDTEKTELRDRLNAELPAVLTAPPMTPEQARELEDALRQTAFPMRYVTLPPAPTYAPDYTLLMQPRTR